MYREETNDLREYLRALEDRVRAVEQGTTVRARSWTIQENPNGDIVFTHSNGRMVTITAIGSDTTI